MPEGEGTLLYLDSSALVKLVLPEAESEALREHIRTRPERVASVIAGVEVVRAARRASEDPAVEQRAHEVVAGVHLITLSESLLTAATTASPRSLRVLDALHLETARLLGQDLEGMVVYDNALADAARAAGIRVFAPGCGRDAGD
jgi:predicted nucleic acid-binding protein